MKSFNAITKLAIGSSSFLLVLTCNSLPAAETKSFCEFGSASAVQFGAAGAVWTQTWGEAPNDWFVCPAGPNVGFLNSSVAGVLTTQTKGQPAIGADLILRFPFAGGITLVAADDDDPDAIAGEIEGNMAGEFVADLNAAHAVITENTITVSFGVPLHEGPDALIEVTSTSGKFQSIQAQGDWEWHVSGTITIARDANTDPQSNIFAALSDASLILNAQESVVLSGSYVRSTPTK
jgi:hypothetical protein